MIYNSCFNTTKAEIIRIVGKLNSWERKNVIFSFLCKFFKLWATWIAKPQYSCYLIKSLACSVISRSAENLELHIVLYGGNAAGAAAGMLDAQPVGGGVAYAVQNRLKKAAAFHIVDAEAEV